LPQRREWIVVKHRESNFAWVKEYLSQTGSWVRVEQVKLGHEHWNSELWVRDIPDLDRALEQREPGDFSKLEKTLNQECGERNRRNISV